MPSFVDPRIASLLGSETRAVVLGVLAHAGRPLSGYRIAKTGGVAQPDVHVQLRRLADTGFVVKRRTGWVLVEPSLRELFRGRMRVVGWQDWTTAHRRRERTAARQVAALAALPHPNPPRGWKPRDAEERKRRREKDRVLRRLGLRPSRHG
jgi:hypothetical protein